MPQGVPTAFLPGAVVDPTVARYLEQLQWRPDELLVEMQHHARQEHIPIVSNDTGMLLDMLVRMNRPRHAIEFGTAIGYSSVFIGRALDASATLTSFEIDPVRHTQATGYLSRADIDAHVNLMLGDARTLVQTIDVGVDFAFLDAGKDEYRDYLEASLERMSAGGVIVVDNALMSGTVARGTADGHWSQDSVEGQRSFNAAFVTDERIHGMVLPIGDGVAVGIRR